MVKKKRDNWFEYGLEVWGGQSLGIAKDDIHRQGKTIDTPQGLNDLFTLAEKVYTYGVMKGYHLISLKEVWTVCPDCKGKWLISHYDQCKCKRFKQPQG